MNGGDTHREQERDQRDQANAGDALAQLDGEAGNQHEGERDRQPLIGKMRAEYRARQDQIDRHTDAEYRPPDRVKAQRIPPTRERGCDHDDGQQANGHGRIIDLDHRHQAVELAVKLPI